MLVTNVEFSTKDDDRVVRSFEDIRASAFALVSAVCSFYGRQIRTIEYVRSGADDRFLSLIMYRVIRRVLGDCRAILSLE